MTSSQLQISQATKRYGAFVALAPTDLTVPGGEFLTLLGPSGSGKTTLLSLIAGLSQPDGGSVKIGEADITFSAPYERDIGLVFQNYALFPHMNVEDNIAFPLKMRKMPSEEARRRVAEALDLVRLPHAAKRLPRELSGGQQQRVALARCIVYRPSIILMDEPLGALDKKLRDQMQLEIKRIHRELRTTIIYVTHDQEEAMTMSDRVCLMNAGCIEQLGTPDDLYFRPRTLFVADFLGESNLLPGRVTHIASDGLRVSLPDRDGLDEASGNGDAFRVGQPVRLMVRPQNLVVTPGAAPGKLTARVTEVMVSGSLTKLYLQPTGAGLPPMMSAHPTRALAVQHAVGDVVSLDWHASDAVAIDDSEAA